MNNKKGFTLVELLAVIALLCIVTTIAVTGVIKIYNKAINKSFDTVVNQIEEAAILYVKDYCEYPIGTDYVCPNGLTGNYNTGFTGAIDLNVLKESEYVEKVTFRGKDCTGNITYTNSKPKAIITCGEYTNVK